MSVPRLNRRLILESPYRVSDSAGGFTQDWVPIGVIWGDVRSRTGKQNASAGAPVSSVAYKIIVRAEPPGHSGRPLPEQRLRDGSRVFNLTAITEYDADGRYLACFADEEIVA